MPESAEHLALVAHIVRHIEREFRASSGLVILTDLPESKPQDKPPRVGGYAPDVYAVDVPCTFAVIGEAKTADDLPSTHSRDQIRAFLEFLRFKQRGILVLAVPWQCVASAQIVVSSVRRSVSGNLDHIQVVILDGITQ